MLRRVQDVIDAIWIDMLIREVSRPVAGEGGEKMRDRGDIKRMPSGEALVELPPAVQGRRARSRKRCDQL